MARPVIVLRREISDDHGTFGRLYLDGEPYCHVVEPPWRDNRKSISCITRAEYLCTWHRSPRFRWVYIVNKVTNRTDILIHAGNYAGDRDKGLRTHTWGCILPGRARGWLGEQRAVLTSKSTLRRFFVHMRQQPFTLRIEGVV